MRLTWFSSFASKYALLLVILFAIAAVAAWSTISYLAEQTANANYTAALKGTSFAIWALTMGFMMIAGAFGLWGISLSGEVESRRRISELVDNLDYIRDGVMAVDRRGRIRGANPGARRMGKVAPRAALVDAFACLSAEDARALLAAHEPNEVKRETLSRGERCVLRFRSQPGKGVALVFVSDVTAVARRETRREQIARYELIGRLARGVSHDFNRILENIAGHASLLARSAAAIPEAQGSLRTIDREARRGALLAEYLLGLSESGRYGVPTDRVGEHVAHAVELLKSGLSDGWNVKMSVASELPLVSLSGVQIEQIVLNLGVAAAEAVGVAGTLLVTACRPGEGHLPRVDERYAAVIVVSASRSGDDTAAALSERPESTAGDAGAIESVVRSVVEDSGGELHAFRAGRETVIFRVVLAYGSLAGRLPEGAGEPIPDEIKSYLARWRVMVAGPARSAEPLPELLREIGVTVVRVGDTLSALSRVEAEGATLHGMVLERSMLGVDADALLRALVKLCPAAAVVVLCDDLETAPEEMSREVVFESTLAHPQRVVRALVEAKALAVRRRSAGRRYR